MLRFVAKLLPFRIAYCFLFVFVPALLILLGFLFLASAPNRRLDPKGDQRTVPTRPAARMESRMQRMLPLCSQWMAEPACRRDRLRCSIGP